MRFFIDRYIMRERVLLTASQTLMAIIIGLSLLFAAAHGAVDSLGRPLGTDCSNVWTAGWMVDHRQAAA